ncbi:related to glucan 1,4-alpha-glucosidase [Rhynchosporium graminicola]|uniref:Related to glucan 1,4-alpha-glucosidase n=1 Tax=Rhynchosporium graminicola TaxID=2792576 RepID=A0A1E1K070_9HELO|nr:related to glucan 1,4-alpha-glucosidase [Rhynchosporium commune]
MAGPERRSMGTDRRELTRYSHPPQLRAIQLDTDDDEDDDDLAAMGISDGYRPGAMTGHNQVSSDASQHIMTGRRTPPPRPSSTTKPQALDTFALRHDGGMDGRRSSTAASSYSGIAPTRSSSISTDPPYNRPESPYRGPSGPTHPYQMYPQESRMARTASIATTSTIPVPDRPYNGPGGPTHPYGMYPQNTVPEAENPGDPNPLAPVAVGFPGLCSDYQRRLGPDGEEIADIIGPDGHTEQLPPYSKYPDEALARKTRPTIAMSPPGAGGMGLATRNPEFSSTEGLDSPSRQYTRSINSATSEHQVNMGAIPMSEKPELKKWQKAARRKLCGIVPVWVAILVTLVFIMFVVILATVLAVLKPGQTSGRGRDGTPPSIVVTTTTSTFDATPLSASPTGTPDLPTGTFALPISTPSAIQNSCLSNTQQSAAWSCSIPIIPYTITVNPVEFAGSELSNNEVSLSIGNNTLGNYYAFGTQPPVLKEDQTLNLVMDNQEPEKGPAWFFEMTYNKLVILPEGAITAPTANVKRGKDEKGDSQKGSGKKDGDRLVSDFARKGIAQPGDSPWFCYWNGTLLEAFIYVNLTSNAGRATASSPASVTATATTTYPGSTPSATSAQPAVYSDSSSSGYNQELQFPVPYPKVVKIEERRIPGPQEISPYCVQHVIDDWGAANVARNSSGLPIIVYLNETDSLLTSDMESKPAYGSERDDNDLDTRDLDDEVGCSCVWLLT